MPVETNWKNGATPTRFVWQYLCCQRQNIRLHAPAKACGDLVRRPNHEPTSLSFNWLNGVSAENENLSRKHKFKLFLVYVNVLMSEKK